MMAQTRSDGAPPRRTGAPLPGGASNEATCASSNCHDSFALNSGPGRVSILAPDTYTPGEALDVTIRVEQTGRMQFGFQFTVKDDAHNFVGGFEHVDPEKTQTTVIPEYATHTGLGIQQSEWTVRWIAPSEDVGPVTIYAVGNATNANFNPSGDHIYTTNKTLTPNTSTAIEPLPAPRAFTLDSAYPNPFAGQTTLAYTLREAGPVTLALYDAQGRRVRLQALGVQPAGAHTFSLEAGRLPAGLYLYELRTPAHRQSRPLLLIK